jgi:hypothetical protein
MSLFKNQHVFSTYLMKFYKIRRGSNFQDGNPVHSGNIMISSLRHWLLKQRLFVKPSSNKTASTITTSRRGQLALKKSKKKGLIASTWVVCAHDCNVFQHNGALLFYKIEDVILFCGLIIVHYTLGLINVV